MSLFNLISLDIILHLLFKLLNIYSILVTILVLKLENFKEVKEEHSLNIPLILVTLFVLKLDKFKELKEEHLLNRQFILLRSTLTKHKTNIF